MKLEWDIDPVDRESACKPCRTTLPSSCAATRTAFAYSQRRSRQLGGSSPVVTSATASRQSSSGRPSTALTHTDSSAPRRWASSPIGRVSISKVWRSTARPERRRATQVVCSQPTRGSGLDPTRARNPPLRALSTLGVIAFAMIWIRRSSDRALHRRGRPTHGRPRVEEHR